MRPARRPEVQRWANYLFSLTLGVAVANLIIGNIAVGLVVLALALMSRFMLWSFF